MAQHEKINIDLRVQISVGALCELVNREDGSMARKAQCLRFAEEHGLKCITIADLIQYRIQQEDVRLHL